MGGAVGSMRLEDDLDEEDRAILQEVASRGYYHGRPPSQATAPPQRIVEVTPQECKRRSEFDDFQRKWDKFDNDDYLDGLERAALPPKAPSTVAKAKPRSVEEGQSPAKQAARKDTSD